MQIDRFVEHINSIGIDFFTGVPDSQLRELSDFLFTNNQVQHIIAPNEGNCVGIAAGYHISTGKVGCVYMQNSGIGNVVNPYTSLIHSLVYKIPVLFIIGWRGEPDVKDEPQHLFQGKITLPLLECLGIDFFVLDGETNEDELIDELSKCKNLLEQGNSAAIVVRKEAFSGSPKVEYSNDYTVLREEAIDTLIDCISLDDVIVSTTGKTSRELFEIREKRQQGHANDFLTVGSMGHCSMIALGIALNTEEKRVWCFDGDGAVLMHLGSLALIGAKRPKNFVHVLMNNHAHESVGGMPTISDKIDIVDIARACGYKKTYSASTLKQIKDILRNITIEAGPIMFEIKVKIGARENLGRPTKTPIQNKADLMRLLLSNKDVL